MSAYPLMVIPTPIGNLEDITYRCVRCLKEVDFILAEDTRTSAKLMKAYDISTPLRAFHMHNEHVLCEKVAQEIEDGAYAALVTDAGMPGISDPGYLLVRSCLSRGVEVCCLPGASAAITALVGSGLPCERFRFEGFLPPKKGRQARLESLQTCQTTTVYYEAPTRLVKFLDQLHGVIEDERQIVVARELTKMHEEYHRGTLAELRTYFAQTPPQGEMVVLVGPAPKNIREHTNKYKLTN